MDDVVLMKDPAKLRPYWYLGIVLELLKGDDDNVRSVKMRRPDGGIHNHSLKHLYPLELGLTHYHRAKGPLDEVAESDVVSSGCPLEQVEPVDSGHDLRPRRPMRSENDSFFWLSQSPDLNPIENLWVIKKNVNKRKRKNLVELKKKIIGGVVQYFC